ncbi:MAG: tetratricopeptide repeat protein [Vicingaceae bacterium]
MRQQELKVLSLAVAASVGIMACNPLAKMVKRQNEVNYEVTPNPAEMHGDSIAITVKGSFPEKYFHKKVSATVTPVLVYGGSEQAFDAFKLKGEDSEAEGTVINYEKGGSFTHSAVIPYKDGMHMATIELRATGEFKGKTKDLDGVKAADGTIITPKLVQPTDKPILGKDKFQKFWMEDNKVEIHYLVNSSVVRGSEMTDADIKDLKAKIKAYTQDPKMEFNSLVVDAYASPEGELSKNDNLANERAASGAKSIQDLLKSAKVELPEGAATLTGKGEDWDGFKKLMQESDIKDKELIIRVLEMYSDLNKREEEIKNLAATYNEVAKKILPPLRRSQINLVMKHHNLTDDEIKTLVDTKPDSLDEEQLLYAATLYNDLSKKEKIYKDFSRIYPNDWRGPNNLGYVYIQQNKLNEAKAEFDKAMSLSADNPIVHNNLGVIERLKGNIAGAEEHYAKASGAGSEVNENMGIVNIIKGKYEDAVSNFSGVNSFNAALANVLQGNTSAAIGMIDGSAEKDDAISYYLKAIIGARNGDNDLMINNLKTAISKDASLKQKAKEDAEFIKYRENADFQAVVN